MCWGFPGQRSTGCCTNTRSARAGKPKSPATTLIVAGLFLMYCGERACPALDCEAAPKPATEEYLTQRIPSSGSLRNPARGKPARHNCSVRNCKSGAISRRYQNNGYVLNSKPQPTLCRQKTVTQFPVFIGCTYAHSQLISSNRIFNQNGYFFDARSAVAGNAHDKGT